MFIPKGVYEYAPYYWIVLGIFLIAVGTYLGTTGNDTFLIAGIGGGLVACLWGLRVFQRRLSRTDRKPCSTYDEYLDQTCELNVRSEEFSRVIPNQPQD